MSPNFKIPRVATAVLVLGGACGANEEETTSADGIDVSQARQEEVAAAFCLQLLACGFHLDPEIDAAECAASYVSELQELADGNEDCLDAILDYYTCYAAIDCDLDGDDAAERAQECAEDAALEERCDAVWNEDEP